MNYTNGIDVDIVFPALSARRGWSQPTQQTFTPTLSSEVTECVSGRYYNLEHAACSPVSIYSNQEDARISEANFNTFMLDLKKQVAIESLLSAFVVPELVEPSKILYEKQFRTGYRLVPNTGKSCGFQLKLPQGDYATRVESIMLTMSAPCTVTMYAYSDLKQAPVWTKECVVTEGYSQTLFSINDLVLSRLNNEYKGGIVYISYYQQELEDQGVQAVDVYMNWWERYNFIGYQAFASTADYADKTFVRDMFMSNYISYGLNMELSTSRDHTNNIVRNAHVFDNLLGLIMQKKCIELAMNSPRTNGDNRLSRESYEMQFNEVEGLKGGEGIPFRQGLKDKIQHEVRKVYKTFFPKLAPVSTIPPVNSGVGYDYVNQMWGKQV